jgi:hypothetical protein
VRRSRSPISGKSTTRRTRDENFAFLPVRLRAYENGEAAPEAKAMQHMSILYKATFSFDVDEDDHKTAVRALLDAAAREPPPAA